MTESLGIKAISSDNDDYENFLAHVNDSFLESCEGSAPLFTTDAAGLWGAYLGSFTDPADRQHHNCHACRQFIERFGGLVTIDAEGRTTPAVWHDGAPEHFRPAVAGMARIVRRAEVTGVFLSSDKVWGIPRTGVWRHLAVHPPRSMRLKHALLTAGQVMAEKREDYRTVSRALAEITLPHLETALTLLRSDALYRGEKVLGQAEWLHALYTARLGLRGRPCRENVTWRAVATAPAGFCHPRSGMIGTLLNDLVEGKSYDDVARAFAEKMHPLQYLRPQAAPKAGAIAAAEEIVRKLGAAGALRRRFARVDEVRALWRPGRLREQLPADGVFSHLRPKGAAASPQGLRIPAQVMTWVKFEATVLPTAERIEIQAPSYGGYVALVTAADPDAPPILQWDLESARNPVSWYVYNHGSAAESWGLRRNRFHEVCAVTLKPSMWNGGFEHQGKGVIFLIEGAHDTRTPSACLFPEILKAEFHGARSVIESYSRGASIETAGGPLAAGLLYSSDATHSFWGAAVRVWSRGQALEYRLDRWD